MLENLCTRRDGVAAMIPGCEGVGPVHEHMVTEAPMANDPGLTLTDVQAVLRHASIETTGRYTAVRVEDIFDKLQEHYNRPRLTPVYSAGYAAEDIKAVFGG